MSIYAYVYVCISVCIPLLSLVCLPPVTNIHSLDGEEKATTLRLEDLLTFVTGADQIPPLGFANLPQVLFIHQLSGGVPVKVPMASTCAPSISLPATFETYEPFKAAMVEGIVGGFGFGLI